MKQLTPTTSQQTNIDAAVANATNINNVASQISPTNNIATVAGDSSPINTLAGVSGLSALATAESSGHITNVSNNLSGVNSFAERYRIASSAPTSSLDGNLYFDTTQMNLKFINHLVGVQQGLQSTEHRQGLNLMLLVLLQLCQVTMPMVFL